MLEHEDCVGGTTPSVVINEIVFDPIGDDGGREWVELVNASDAPVDLSSWRLAGDRMPEPVGLPPWTLPPGAFLLVLLGPEEEDADLGDGSGIYAVGATAEFLDNVEGEVALYDGPPDAATVVDFLCWSSSGTYLPGSAHAHAVTAGAWTDGTFVELSIHSPAIEEGYTLRYDKVFESGRLEQSFEENLEAAREILSSEPTPFEGGAAQFEEAEVEDAGSAPETSILTELATSHAVVTVERTGADRVVLDAHQHVEDDGLVSDIAARRETRFLSDVELEVWVERTLESNVEDTIVVRNHHHGVRFLGADNATLLETHLEYLDYEIEAAGSRCMLAGAGSFHVHPSQEGRQDVQWTIPVLCEGGGPLWQLSGHGYLRHAVVDGEEILQASMQDAMTGETIRMYIDGTPGEVTGTVVCAVAGAMFGAGLINGWHPGGWIAVGVAGGLGLASYFTGKGVQVACDELGAKADGTEPAVGGSIVLIQPTPRGGVLDFDLVITDNKCIYQVKRKVFNEQGKILSSKTYVSAAGRGSPTTSMTVHMHLLNGKPAPVTWTIVVEVVDNAGNVRRYSQQVTIPPKA